MKRRVIMPLLIFFMLGIGYIPELLFGSSAISGIVNRISTVRVAYAAPLTEEELEEYPDEAPKESDIYEMDASIGIMNDERTLARVKWCQSTKRSEVYLTTKGYLNYPKLRAALEEEYGEDFMLSDGPNSTAYSTYYEWKDILKSKTERKKLAKIAAKYIPGVKASYVAAPEIALATYYGAINDPWDYVKYSNNKAITKSQMCALIERFKYSNYQEYDIWISDGMKETMGKDYKYNIYLSSCSGREYPGMGIGSKKEAEMAATHKEVLYLVMMKYYSPGVGNTWGMSGTTAMTEEEREAYQVKAVKKAKKIFKDLDNADNQTCLLAYRLYKLGVIKPDKNGNSNLNKKCSMSWALRYCYACYGVDIDMPCE